MRFSIPALLFACLIATVSNGQDLNCLTNAERAKASLYAALQQEAYAALDRRDQHYETLKTPAQIRQHQAKLRQFMVEQLGGFPERTPLNAKTSRTLVADDYRIECVIFESQKNHHVTANLYLPNTDSPVPGIVVSSGHSRTAKTADYNQRFGIMMAKQGMAALCFDPIGQGERSQILDDQGQPEFGGTTTEHFLVGVGSILVGRNTARYRIWDAIRAIDYLAERPEIDADRIGFTGCSGGGTLTSYVMALDDRVACAAPACYLTNFRRLIETIGPQDAEQNIYGQIAFGLDHPDYVLMRAPKPTLISSTTEDFFDIQGSWSTFRQAKRSYGKLGYPERVDLVEIEGKHGVQPQNLATIAHWFRRWLLNTDASVPIADLKTRPPEQLLCLESGQVLTLEGEKSVFELNADFEQELAAKRTIQWKQSDQQMERVLDMLGIQRERAEPPTWEDRGRVERNGYHVDKVVIRTSSQVPITALTFHPPEPAEDAYLYLHDDGKLGDSTVGGPIEKIVQQGYAVVSVDLRGQGETFSGKQDEMLTDWKTYFLSYLLGKPLLGGRVEDTLAAADFVQYYQKQRDDPRQVHVIGVGRAGIVALHVAAVNPQLFASVTLRDTPASWADVVRQVPPAGQLDSTVHGALTVYDFPDLVRIVGEQKVNFTQSESHLE